jgi:hypothetical protein
MINKPNTQRLLDRTRKINSEVKGANQAAGAVYDDRWIPTWQSAPFGAGSEVPVAGDMPTSDHEYMGHKLIKQRSEPWHWTIEAIDFPTHPNLKNSTFTDVPSCERAIREYWDRERQKSEGMR